MADPIQIMDEIERGDVTPILGKPIVDKKLWQSLRTAIEAQAEELAQMRSKHAHVELLHEKAEKELFDLKRETAQKDARIARLEQAAKDVTECLASQVPNYLEDLAQALNESPAQSAAHLKAEAFRKFAARIDARVAETSDVQFNIGVHLSRAVKQEADIIEREAKGESDG